MPHPPFGIAVQRLKHSGEIRQQVKADTRLVSGTYSMSTFLLDDGICVSTSVYMRPDGILHSRATVDMSFRQAATVGLCGRLWSLWSPGTGSWVLVIHPLVPLKEGKHDSKCL